MIVRRDTSAPGQAMEFSIWTELIQQSRGVLHVFLPLLDRGLDAVIHRLTDGEYIPVQVKSRGSMVEGMVEIVVPAVRLVDDRALLIAGLLTDDGLGPMLLVVDESTFKRLAARDEVQGQAVYSAAFSMHPTKATHWLPYLSGGGWQSGCSARHLRLPCLKPYRCRLAWSHGTGTTSGWDSWASRR